MAKFLGRFSNNNPSSLGTMKVKQLENGSSSSANYLTFSAMTNSAWTLIRGLSSYYNTLSMDSRPTKASDTGAVAYLMISEYGLGTTRIGYRYYYSSGYLPYLYYSTGGKQNSTTGNLYGVFEGGGSESSTYARQYLAAGNIRDRNLLDAKYYDSYTIPYTSQCTFADCGGQALYETLWWDATNSTTSVTINDGGTGSLARYTMPWLGSEGHTTNNAADAYIRVTLSAF
jgi:hypothetical protein